MRGTRATVFNNENPRPTRLGVTRSTKAAPATTTTTSKDTAATADGRLKPSVTTRRGLAVQQENILPGKRKRGALTETTNDKSKKVVVDVPTKVPVTRSGTSVSSSTTTAATEKPSAITTTTSRLRQPLTKTKNSDAPPIQIHEDNVDVRKPAPAEIPSGIPTTTRASRRLPTRSLASKTTTASTAVAATTATSRRANTAKVMSVGMAATTTTTAKTTTEVGSHKVTTGTTRVKRIHTRHAVAAAAAKAKEIAEEEVDEPVHKKRRISSEDDEAVALKIHEEATVSDPAPAVVKPEDGEPDDLDKEDLDDPLMVSEYVGEIFQYLRKVEVSIPLFPQNS